MTVCTPKCRKWTVFGFAVFFIVIGLVFIFCTGLIVQAVKDKELNVGSDDTTEYKMWEVTPIPMFIEFYLFNWTNWQEVVDSKWEVKPKFVEMGPYTYAEKHYRKHVIFNDNHTVTYQTQRIWHYAPEKSAGSIDDLITTANPILLTVGAMVRSKHPIVKMGVNFFLEEKRINLTVTKTAREFIFDGYDDPLLDLFKKLHLRNINLPFDRFAWFATRNGSIEYDGTYNMYDGTDDIRKLGKFAAWNYDKTTPYYPSYCGQVNGTSGELWYPVKDDEVVQVFSPDVCSTLTLYKKDEEELHGVSGHRYVADERTFDNGTKFPEMACFNPGDGQPSGVRNISECKFGAPAFISLPHFYLADPYYRQAIDGMTPNASEHRLFISVEPETGIPLEAHVSAQINLRIEPIDRIKLFNNVKLHYLPSLWFKQYAILDEALASQARLILVITPAGQYTGYGLLGLGCVCLAIFGFVSWKKLWKAPNVGVLPINTTKQKSML